MQTGIERRRSRFLKALAARGISQAGWAKSQGVTKGHLSLVLNGKRESDKLTERIDSYVREWLDSKVALAS